jgi:hypothetical protein
MSAPVNGDNALCVSASDVPTICKMIVGSIRVEECKERHVSSLCWILKGALSHLDFVYNLNDSTD